MENQKVKSSSIDQPDGADAKPAFKRAKESTIFGFALVAPNNDTIYVGCALDLRAEPAVLRVPAVKDQYYGIQFVSAVTDDFAYVGTRTTGTDSGAFLIAGPSGKWIVPPIIRLK